MNYFKTKSFFTACFIFCFGIMSCRTKINTTDTWDSAKTKHTMPDDSTINKIDTSSLSPLVDTVKMMTDTSNR